MKRLRVEESFDHTFIIKYVYSDELMNDRFTEKLTLGDLALAAGVHPVTVSHYFPKYFACTFGAYMRKLKIAHALERSRSRTSLVEVAYECGFFDRVILYVPSGN